MTPLGCFAGGFADAGFAAPFADSTLAGAFAGSAFAEAWADTAFAPIGRVKDAAFPVIASAYGPLATFESIWAGAVEAGLFCPIGRGGGA